MMITYSKPLSGMLTATWDLVFVIFDSVSTEITMTAMTAKNLSWVIQANDGCGDLGPKLEPETMDQCNQCDVYECDAIDAFCVSILAIALLSKIRSS